VHRSQKFRPKPRKATWRATLCLAVCAVCVGAILSVPAAWASTAYVDGISDQNMPQWDHSFASSWFARAPDR
jgi:hypothetical protein